MTIIEQTPERLVLLVPKSESQSFRLLFGGAFGLCALAIAEWEATGVIGTRIALAVLLVALFLTARSMANAPQISITLDTTDEKIEVLKISRNGRELYSEPLSELNRVRLIRPIDPGDGALRFEFLSTHGKSSRRSFPEITVKDDAFKRIEKWIERAKQRQ